MRRLLVTGAGGSPALNFIRSLRLTSEPFHIIGVDSNRFHLALSPADEKHLVPPAADPDYVPVLQQLIAEREPGFLFAQPDPEIAVVSEHRDDLNVRTYLPSRETVKVCQDKFQSFDLWREAGLKVPETRLVRSRDELADIFSMFGEAWLRPVTGAAGRGSLHANDLQSAIDWIDFNKGWGRYTAAEYLSPDSVTWQSIWKEGELVVAQGRKRLYWGYADRTLSGVTGITGAAITVSDPVTDDVALKAITAVDARPHGVFSVDMTYDKKGVPNPTEINIGRFFTTHLFFSQAGLNMPSILLQLAFGEEPTIPAQRINPLPAGLLWIRGMDTEPYLTTLDSVDAYDRELEIRRKRLATSEGVAP